MACSAQSVTIESYLDNSAFSSAYATPSEETSLLRDRKRRHSFHTARKLSCDYDADAVFLRVGFSFPCRRTPTNFLINRSNSSLRNWKDASTGSNNIADPIWYRSMPAYAEHMQH